MIFYYLDASAWVKRYHSEVGTQWISELFLQGPAIFCSSLGWIEVSATLARKQKSGAFDRAQLEKKLYNLDYDWNIFLQLQISAEIAAMAIEVTRRYALRGADSIHLASGLFIQENFVEPTDEFTFVTSDRELIVAAEAAKLTVIDPTTK